MTDDIVDRLRAVDVAGMPFNAECDCIEAADEIERLREALRAMMYAYPYSVPCLNWQPKAEAHSLARAALSPPVKEPTND